jgi:hypothetical protein
MQPWMTMAWALALSVMGSGCTLVADLDSLQSVDDLGCDLTMRVDNFTPHRGDMVLFQAVTRDTNELRAMAVIDPLVDPNRRFTMPNAVAEGAHAFNFWADVNDDGFVQTSPFAGTDHSWRLENACDYVSTCTDGEEQCFTHISPFDTITDPIELGNTLDLTVDGLPLSATTVEVHLVEHDDRAQLRRVVGLYRRDDIGEIASFNLVLRGLARDNRVYSIDLMVDLNGDGTIDGATEVWELTESMGSVYANPVTVDVSNFDPSGVLPPEFPLVSDLPTP